MIYIKYILMSGEVTSDKIKTVITETIREVLQKEVTSFGTGAHVICPKEHLGRKVYLVVCEE